MLKGLGCSTRLLAGVSLVVLLLLLIGFVAGPIGSSLFGDIEWLSFIKVSEPHVSLPGEAVFHAGGFPVTNTLLASLLATLLLVTVAYSATRRMQLIPGRFQSAIEAIVEALLGFIESVAGKGNARRFFPVVATIFIFVITNAYLALLPFFGSIGISGEHGSIHLFRAANTDVNLPLAIAVVAFVSVEYWGLRSLGISGYLNNFFNLHPLTEGLKQLAKGRVRPAISGVVFGIINIVVGALEVFSHLIRLVSFTFRLFGNMTAGEILLLVVTFLVPFIVSLPFYGLELLIGFIQALIFAGLTLVFAVIAVAAHGEEAT